MAVENLTFPVSDLKLRLQVTLPKALTVRIWVASRLIALASLVLRKAIKVELLQD